MGMAGSVRIEKREGSPLGGLWCRMKGVCKYQHPETMCLRDYILTLDEACESLKLSGEDMVSMIKEGNSGLATIKTTIAIINNMSVVVFLDGGNRSHFEIHSWH